MLDDNLPELAESFQIALVSAESGDGKPGSTPTSGASIDPNNSVNTITVTANDHPYGTYSHTKETVLLLLVVCCDKWVTRLTETKYNFLLPSPLHSLHFLLWHICLPYLLCSNHHYNSQTHLFPGLLQFQPSLPGEGLIAPALEPAHITVNEEDGQVRLPVARAQGLLGRVMVGYRTTPFTASSPEDYEVGFP